MFNYLVDASLMKLLRLLRHERCQIDVIMAVTRPQWLHRSGRVMDGRSFCPTINPFIKCSFVGDLEPITLKHFRFLISRCVWKLQLELDQPNKHWQLNSLDKMNNSINSNFLRIIGMYDFFSNLPHQKSFRSIPNVAITFCAEMSKTQPSRTSVTNSLRLRSRDRKTFFLHWRCDFDCRSRNGGASLQLWCADVKIVLLFCNTWWGLLVFVR